MATVAGDGAAQMAQPLEQWSQNRQNNSPNACRLCRHHRRHSKMWGPSQSSAPAPVYQEIPFLLDPSHES